MPSPRLLPRWKSSTLRPPSFDFSFSCFLKGGGDLDGETSSLVLRLEVIFFSPYAGMVRVEVIGLLTFETYSDLGRVVLGRKSVLVLGD